MKIQTVLFILAIFLAPLIANANSINPSNKGKITTYPQHGKTMKHVRTQYGNAVLISHSKGNSSKNWPRITRWDYDSFTVYFEKNLVLHTVVH